MPSRTRSAGTSKRYRPPGVTGSAAQRGKGPHVTETTEAAPKRRSGGGLSGMLLPELKQMAAGLGIKGVGGMRKSQLIDAIKAAQSGGQSEGATGGQSTVQAAAQPA